MSNHYVAINRGLEGTKINDFTLGTSSTASTDVEVRIADVDGQGNTMKRKDVVLALRAIIRAIESGPLVTTFPPL
jgi:hypothetical protein